MAKPTRQELTALIVQLSGMTAHSRKCTWREGQPESECGCGYFNGINAVNDVQDRMYGRKQGTRNKEATA